MTEPAPPKKMTARERLEYRYFYDAMRQFEWDLRYAVWKGDVLPRDWHEVLSQGPDPEKTRVTLRLDDDVVKFFRKFGPGWQAKVNTVVRTFVKARLAGLVEGPESLDSMASGLDEGGGERPQIGDFERIVLGRG